MANNGFMLAKALRNPQEFLNQYMNNSQAMQNPMARNLVDMYKKGDIKGINEMAENMCREMGMTTEQAFQHIRQKYGI